MRDRILHEIRRLAQANDGKAPGKAVFARETGISEHEWLGKIWSRWTDIVIEAGLAPNAMQEKFQSAEVIEAFAEACCHFGHIPTNYELRMYGRENQNFPGHSTFSNHFGNKQGVLAKLRSWALENGNTQIIQMLPPEEELIEDSKSEPGIQTSDGYVYLLKSGNHFKVGRSSNLEKRIKQITVALPAAVELYHSIRTDDPAGIEAYWHRRFDARRANGEWFELSPSDIRAFKKRKFM